MASKTITIARAELTADFSRALIDSLNAELSGLYSEPGANHFHLDPEEVADGRGVFLVVYQDGTPVGCGALRLLDAATAELKRMYVSPTVRGTGMGRRLVAALESEARALGVQHLVLETGIRQIAALALYRATGFHTIPLYGEYCLSSETSVCFGKDIQEEIMVLTKSELLSSLHNEVRILLHLASKVDRAKLGYRPTPKQRSTIELLKYLSMMGPALGEATKAGTFDPAAWTAAEQAAEPRDFDQTLAAIAAHTDTYTRLLADVSETDMRAEIEMFGDKGTRGAFMVNLVLCSCAAYRTQLFLYLKAGGREELDSMNLWAGVDSPEAV